MWFGRGAFGARSYYYLRGKKGRFAKVEEREFVGESKPPAQPTASEKEAVTT